jgi:hypothetical protein
MKSPQRGEVWLVDLGMAAKVRPALAISVPADDSDRALVTLVPHTTSPRNSRFEVVVTVPFLRAGVFDGSKPNHNSTRETGQSARQSLRRSTGVHRAGGVPVAWIADNELRGLITMDRQIL